MTRNRLDEVARAAGVSTSTASRALTNHPRVDPDTRRRVLAQAKRLGYRPNRNASALRTNTSRLIGLVVNGLHNATFTSIANALQAGALGRGYQVFVSTTQGDEAHEAAFLDTVLEHQFDGVVVAGTGANGDRIKMLRAAGVAVVLMNREVPDVEAATVMPDYREAGRLATSHLLELGHERIAVVGGLDRYTSGRLHHLGFLDAMAAAGRTVDEDLIHRGPFDPGFGHHAIDQVLTHDRPPTAVLLSNHEATFGVLPVLNRRGVHIPEELSIICTEDAPWFSWWQPPISVVDNNATRMGELALQGLFDQFANANTDTDIQHVVVPPRLDLRATTDRPGTG